MYSFKEKNKFYYDLQNVDFAEADLRLLCVSNPSDQIIDRARRTPQRCHKEVLYQLLDFRTAEEIRLNRRARIFSPAEAAPVDVTPEPIIPEAVALAADVETVNADEASRTVESDKKKVTSSKKKTNIPTSAGARSSKKTSSQRR